MLKLTMVQGETINIGDNIQIQLASDTVYRAKILIDAPKEVAVTREHAEKEGGEIPTDTYKTPKSKISIVDNRRKK